MPETASLELSPGNMIFPLFGSKLAMILFVCLFVSYTCRVIGVKEDTGEERSNVPAK